MTLSVLAGVAVAAAALTRAHGFLAIVASWAAWPLSALRGLPLLGRTISATSRVSVLWPVVRTVAFSLLVLVVFGGLFATGDAVFGSWASALVPDLGWDTIVLRGFLFVLVTGVALTGAYLALNPPNADRVVLPEGGAPGRSGSGRCPSASSSCSSAASSSHRPPRCGVATPTCDAPPASRTPSTCTRASAS
nr:DUF4153 domain-containing protein [Phycicoccus sp. HDW14]